MPETALQNPVHALVTAAGGGRRMGGPIRKQYLELDGEPILVQTLRRLAALPRVGSIDLVVPEEDLDWCREELVARFRLQKIGAVLAGGAERQDSVRKGVLACGVADDQLLLVHDGVRPYFPVEALHDLLAAAERTGAALLAIPAQDTIKEVVAGQVRRTLDRSRLWQVQTPQAFRAGLLREAHRRAVAAGYQGTDDASLLEWCGQPVAVVPGSTTNIKITTPADLALARALRTVEESK